MATAPGTAPAAAGAPDRDSEINLADLLLLVDPNNILRSIWRLRRAFWKVYLVVLAAICILLPLSLIINATDGRGWNLVFLFALAAIGIWHAVDPFKWLTMFGAGVLFFQGIPNAQIGQLIRLNFPDFRIQEFLSAGGRGIKAYWDFLIVVWLFLAMWFSVLATIPVNTSAAYGFAATLLMSGAITLKWPSAQLIYKRTCIFVTTLMMIIWGVLTFLGGGALEARVRSLFGDVATPVLLPSVEADNLVVSTKPVPLSHFVDRNSDGIFQEGERTPVSVKRGGYRFTAKGPDTAWSHHPGQLYDVAAIIRINGNDSKHDFCVEKDGPVKVSFDPSFGSGRLIDTGPGGYEVVNITLHPTRMADCKR